MGTAAGDSERRPEDRGGDGSKAAAGPGKSGRSRRRAEPPRAPGGSAAQPESQTSSLARPKNERVGHIGRQACAVQGSRPQDTGAGAGAWPPWGGTARCAHPAPRRSEERRFAQTRSRRWWSRRTRDPAAGGPAPTALGPSAQPLRRGLLAWLRCPDAGQRVQRTVALRDVGALPCVRGGGLCGRCPPHPEGRAGLKMHLPPGPSPSTHPKHRNAGRGARCFPAGSAGRASPGSQAPRPLQAPASRGRCPPRTCTSSAVL